MQNHYTVQQKYGIFPRDIWYIVFSVRSYSLLELRKLSCLNHTFHAWVCAILIPQRFPKFVSNFLKMKLQTKVELRNDCKDLIVRLLSTSAEEGSFLVLIRTAKANISASMCRLVVNQLSGAFTTTDLGLSKLLPDPRIKYNNLLVDRSRCLVFLSSNIGIELITLRSGSLRLLGRIPYIVENGRLCFDQYRGEMLILTDYIRCAVIAPHLTEDGERFPIAEPIAYYRSYWTDLGAYDGSNPLEPLFDGQPVHEYHRVTPDYTAYCVSTKETRCVASFYQFGDQPPTFTKVNVKWEGCAIVQRVYYHQYKGSEPIAIDFDADGICYCLGKKSW